MGYVKCTFNKRMIAVIERVEYERIPMKDGKEEKSRRRNKRSYH